MKKLFKVLVWLGVFTAINLVSFLWIVPLFIPLPGDLARPNDPSTIITDDEGKPLRRFLVNGEEVISDYASLEEIPTDFVNATVAAEDKRFWVHRGIDFMAIGRAVLEAVEAGRPISGASTITQQLVKITDVPRPRGVRAKVIEMITARKIEMFHSKEWILENYINRLPYGNMRTGCRAAAQGYFGKPLVDLSLAETALLAALPNKPTRFNPYQNFQGAQERQFWILDRMLEDGYIDERSWERAYAEELVLTRGPSAFRAPHAVELMLTQHPDRIGPGEVRSTLNLKLQKHAEQAIDEHLQFISLHRSTSPYLHAAAVVIENASGHVKVLTGSRDYFDKNGGQINGAWTPRSPGSALKPFTYLLALENGFSTSTILADVPTEFPTSTGVYRPVNYDRTYTGPVSIRQALGNSLNIPAVRMLQQLGGPAPLQEVLHRLGVTTIQENSSQYGLGLTIGSAEVRLLELTNAYACLARLGVYKPYSFFPEDDLESQRIFSEETCYILADILSDPAARAQSFGWNNPLHLEGLQVAAKTGTSSDYRDAWTLGFTPEFTVGVWVGNFDNSPLDRFSGVAGAGPIFHAIMEHLAIERGATWYQQPPSVIQRQIDPLTGRCVPPGIRINRPTTVELFLESSPPMAATPSDYDTLGRIYLPGVYAAWLETAPRQIKERMNVRTSAETSPFHITSPLPGMVIFLDPDLPNGGRLLRLSTDQNSPIIWSSNTLSINPADQTAHLVPGDHSLVAEDPETGLQQSVKFRVDEI